MREGGSISIFEQHFTRVQYSSVNGLCMSIQILSLHVTVEC